MKRTWILFVTSLLWISVMISACRSTAELSEVHIHEEVSGVLRIAYADESEFLDRFGRIFKFYYPNVQLRIVSANYPDVNNTARIPEYLERESPDVLVLDRILYAGLSRQGFLVNLDDWFVNESIDLSVYADTVMDALSKDGGGNIYGVAPFFVSRVLFYNMDLFDQYGIPYPESGMTWDQMLELALQFARKGSVTNGHYGFHLFSSSKNVNPFNLVRTIAESENISLTNENNDIELIGSRIEEIYRLVIEGLRLGIIAPPVDDLLNEGFYGGQAGMMVGNYYDLRDASIWSFKWGIASEPSPDGTTPNYQLDTIFAFL